MSVKLYSTGCPRCVILKKKLDAKGIKYSMETDRATMLEKGFKEVPMLEVDGKLFGFAQAVAWVNSKQ